MIGALFLLGFVGTRASVLREEYPTSPVHIHDLGANSQHKHRPESRLYAEPLPYQQDHLPYQQDHLHPHENDFYYHVKNGHYEIEPPYLKAKDFEDLKLKISSDGPIHNYHSHMKWKTLDPTFFEDEDSHHIKSMRQYGLHDALRVEEPLLQPNNTVSYEILRNSPHGRHLLLVTLLEGFSKDCWKPRCMGHLVYYLPESLKSPNQPSCPPHITSLKDIYVNGQLVTRKDILDAYRHSPASVIAPGKSYSRFKARDVAAVNAMAKFVLSFDTFDAILSVLVVLREVCNRQVFIEVLILVIQVRSDVGFIVPNLQSIRPESFFPAEISQEDLHGHWNKRSTGDQSNLMDYYDRYNPVKTFSYKTTHRTLPKDDPESELWHLREDVMVNSMHGIWHILMSDPQAPWVMKRRGELFYHMHKQMLCRYNADRLAVGLKPVKQYSMNDWGRPVLKGYNPRLGADIAAGGTNYPLRKDGKRFSDEAIEIIQYGVNVVKHSLRQMRINNTRLGYSRGIDHGISILGDLLEPYPDLQNPDAASLLHNYGHVVFSEMSEGSSDEFTGVMGYAETAMRDPVFWNWHKFTDDFFTDYKSKLGPYENFELDFPGVQVTSISSTSGGKRNHLRTFTDFNTLELDRNLLTTMNGTIMRYERLNHDPYLFNIRVHSEVQDWAIGRIFLIPSKKIWDNDMIDSVIEMDKFLIELNRGMNVITRRAVDSPLMTTGAPSLLNLQEHLLKGISETEFNWGNCGWPIELALPRGNAAGQKFVLVVMLSKLHPKDHDNISTWLKLDKTAWGWCGMRQGEGSFPDSRPMGFPFDRPTTLMKILGKNLNMKTTTVHIRHTG